MGVNVKTFQSLFPVTVTGNSDWKIFIFNVLYVFIPHHARNLREM